LLDKELLISMKILKQLGLLFIICLIGLIIEKLLPFAFPASVIAMILLFFCLLTGTIKLEQVKTTTDFLMNNMTILFIPACVGLINYFDVLKANLVPIVAISVISTLLTFLVTALSIRLTTYLMNRRNRHD